MSKTTTPIWQRVAIWIIAIAMLGGTIVGFVFMVLATQDSDIDPQAIAENMMKFRRLNSNWIALNSSRAGLKA